MRMELIKKSRALLSSSLHDLLSAFLCLVNIWPSLLLTLYDLFGALNTTVDLFGISTQVPCREIDSNQLMTQPVSRRPELIQLMTRATFQELAQNQLMTEVDSPGIDSDQLMTENVSHFRFKFSPWLKRKSFYSESTHASTLSHTHVCPSVIPTLSWVVDT